MIIRTSKLLILLIIIFFCACRHDRDQVNRPKIVVGIVIDQMRWDYLYRYYERYGHSGFRRLLRNGYSCNNTSISYLPSYTAPGHACIYTGSVPAIHGIAGNDWVDRRTGAKWYCVQDTSVTLTGGDTKGQPMSPANLLTTTITDELRLATNFASRVYGVALKDRGSILPAGHLANAAYWYSEHTGGFISSSYYKDPEPEWLKAFNNRKTGDSMVQEGWYPLYDISTYTQSTADSTPWEGPFKWEKAPVFPHRFDGLDEEKRRAVIKSIPAGNTYTLMMAKACMQGESLGKGSATDMITISLSSTDYIGHRFAINSIEAEDTYLRLDRDISDLLLYLDKTYGRNGYLVFLTADHGAAHNGGFLAANGIPAGIEGDGVMDGLNGYLHQTLGLDSIVTFMSNYQVCFDEVRIAASGKDRETVKLTAMAWLNAQPNVAYAIDMENIWRNTVPEPIRTMAVNGYHNHRSGSIQVVLNPGCYNGDGHTTGTTHGTWNPYDSHIPLLWYGWHIKRGASDEPVHMTDIAPTLASLLHIQMPSGCVGKPIIGLKKEH
ncbi:alkaline phosphatase family protein [Nemorincola caseinilytica]|uniref:Alkaline phosphatase family protein n=1 Tax=Nemorincola caseinilytica TaxID=2054315 RepID=A0ABP8N687_9BACT